MGENSQLLPFLCDKKLPVAFPSVQCSCVVCPMEMPVMHMFLSDAMFGAAWLTNSVLLLSDGIVAQT